MNILTAGSDCNGSCKWPGNVSLCVVLKCVYRLSPLIVGGPPGNETSQKW